MRKQIVGDASHKPGHVPNLREGTPEVLIDVPGVVGQFLTDLTPFDVVVELIQNELDAGSKKTKIVFGTEVLICEGSGNPIDPTGWDRLRYVLGAGADVAAKVGGIGAKNHGLRSAFLLGDTIHVQSDGHRIDLTVRGGEPDSSRFFPAVWPKILDPTAPRNGTKITVPYRKIPLMVPDGDNTRLDVVTLAKIEKLFAEAVKYSPSRFIAASAPGCIWRYELTLEFAEMVSKFVFECEPLKGKHAGLFRRTCRLEETGQRARIVLRQLGSTFELKLDDNDRAKVPKLFQRETRLLGETSWHVDRNDAPQSGRGALRYPIGYPIEHVKSGYGFDISGPFISGRARHSLSDDKRNELIREAACMAFVEITRKKLIPLFGAKSMDLVSNPHTPDADAEQRLINDLLVAQALPIAKPVSNSKRGILKATPMDASKPSVVTIACTSYDPAHIATNLVRLARSVDNLLHPDVNDRVSAALHQMRVNGDSRVVLFDEFTAARAILIDQSLTPGQAVNSRWIEDAIDVLAALETSRHRYSLPVELVQMLKEQGKLPTEAGNVAQWADLKRSAKPVPAIPGIVVPNILHHRLSKLALLKDGLLKIPTFNLDDFVSFVDFSKADPASRQIFFEWLQKRHSDLATKALVKIACYPIWPGVDGEHRPLDDYCWPKSSDLRTLVHSQNIAPAEAVVSFRGLRRSPNGALRLRTKPTEIELRNWYINQSRTVADLLAEGLTEDAIKAASKIEGTLDMLRKLNEYKIEDVANGHQTFTRSNVYKLVADLHCPTSAVKHCGLLDEDVIGGSYNALYELLDSHQKPTKSALVRALVSDTNQSLLFNRLEAYRSLGHDLSDLSGEPIIIVRGQAMAPGILAFPSSTNWWGDWKTVLENSPDIPERVDLLERVGVVRQALREELSRDFFEWLSNQTKARQLRQLQQIIRHWGESRYGPARWIKYYPTIPCIPVRGRTVDFELLNYKKVTSVHSTVFLPDFREIQDKLIAANASARLAITSVKGVGGSVLDVMREAGVPSLRVKAERPIRISTSEGVETDPQLDALFSLSQSKSVIKQLTHKLPEYDVPTSALRRDWQHRLKELRGVRVTGQLNAFYSVLKREYEVAVESGVDEKTQLLCVNRKADRKFAFYDALAEHLFSENSSRLLAHGLHRAIECRHKPTFFDIPADSDDGNESNEESEPCEADPAIQDPPKKGHGLGEDKLEPVVPKPKPLGDISDETKLSGKKCTPGKGARTKSSTDDRRNSIEEAEQILELKEGHYAWHCQACLGQYKPIEAAPPRSYVYLPSIRRKLIEAHHVEHLQNKGAIGAKNLIVLCTFHHDYYGDQLSFKAIKDALACAKRVNRDFPSNAGGTTSIKVGGLLAEVKMDSAEGRVLLFFTNQHAEAWTKPND